MSSVNFEVHISAETKSDLTIAKLRQQFSLPADHVAKDYDEAILGEDYVIEDGDEITFSEPGTLTVTIIFRGVEEEIELSEGITIAQVRQHKFDNVSIPSEATVTVDEEDVEDNYCIQENDCEVEFFVPGEIKIIVNNEYVYIPSGMTVKELKVKMNILPDLIAKDEDGDAIKDDYTFTVEEEEVYFDKPEALNVVVIFHEKKKEIEILEGTTAYQVRQQNKDFLGIPNGSIIFVDGCEVDDDYCIRGDDEEIEFRLPKEIKISVNRESVYIFSGETISSIRAMKSISPEFIARDNDNEVIEENYEVQDGDEIRFLELGIIDVSVVFRDKEEYLQIKEETTIDEIRKKKRSSLGIVSESVACVNGNKVDGSYHMKDGDRQIEFIVPGEIKISLSYTETKKILYIGKGMDLSMLRDQQISIPEVPKDAIIIINGKKVREKDESKYELKANDEVVFIAPKKGFFASIFG